MAKKKVPAPYRVPKYKKRLDNKDPEAWKRRVAVWLSDRPVLFGRCTGPLYGSPGTPQEKYYCYLTCQCPKCGQELNHGYVPGFDWGYASHRAGHCGCKFEGPSGKQHHGYYIIANPDMSVHEIDPAIPLHPEVSRKLATQDEYDHRVRLVAELPSQTADQVVTRPTDVQINAARQQEEKSPCPPTTPT